MSLQLAVDEETGEWRMPYDDNEPMYRVRLEKAKSGRAKCRMCGEAVKTGCWRVGVPIKWRTYISTWHHPPCFFMKDEPVDVEKGEVHGWAEVEDPNEMIELAKELRKTEPPAHLGGEVDVEDEAFLSGKSADKKKQKLHVPKLPAPSEMTISLLPFQEEGHAWMLDRELNSPEKGGILADEMGLGKTIQTISLIVSAKKQAGDDFGPTLIVAPSSAMLQWQDEIQRCTFEDTLSILVYQSAKRKQLTPADILGVDVVLTSYPILENEYRQAMNAQKVDCVYCGRKFLARKLIPHHKYFCGPEAEKSARLMKTEKTRKESTQKAMRTLRIGTSATSAPTPTAIYRDLMIEAGRTPSSMMSTAIEARELDSQNSSTPVKGESSSKSSVAKQRKATPKSSTAATMTRKPPSSAKKVKSSSSSEEDEEDAFETSDDDEAKTPKKDKKVSFSTVEEVPSSKKRSSAVKAQKTFSQLLLGDSSSKAQKPEHAVVWYGKDLGLFWKIGTSSTSSMWRSPGGYYEEVTSDNISVVLKKGDELIRLSHSCLEISKDGGLQWEKHDSTKSSKRSSLWLSPKLDEEEEDDTLRTSGKYVGHAVCRKFDEKDVVGLVFARFEETKSGDPALWRVRHVDGDVEDLEEDEVVNAMNRAENSKKLYLEWLRPSLPRDGSKKRKPKKEIIVIDSASSASSLSSSSSAAEDSEYSEAEEEEESSSEDDDDLVDEDDDEDEVVFVSQTSGGRSSSSTTTTTAGSSEGPRFIPQRWGREKPLKEWAEAQKRIDDNKEKTKKSHQSKRKAKKKLEEREEKATKKNGKASTKKGIRESSSSSSSSSEDEDDEAQFKAADVLFAPNGDVVDDDGVDLNRSLLHCMAWHRIILDEAHKIKERTNSTAKSVFALRGALTKQGPPFPKPELFGIEEDRTAISSAATEAAKRDPNAPKRPKSAYQYFCDAKRPELKDANPDMSAKDIMKMMSEQWKILDANKKNPFDELSEKDKVRFKDEMAKYTPPIVVTSDKKEDEDESSEDDDDEDEDASGGSKKKKVKRTKQDEKKKAPKQEEKKANGDKATEPKHATCGDACDESDARKVGKNAENAPILWDNCRRWALTGTPLMNRLGDLYSLVRFIRVSPYSYYFCKKGCNCRLLQWSFGWDARYCTHCGHTPMSHYSFFNKSIMNPVNRNGYVGAGRRALLLLRDDLLGSIMLRRTKLERKDDLNLPPLTVETTEIQLTSEERDFYESIYKLSQARFDTFVAKGTIMNNYAHVFQLLSRLRQAADHPYLIVAAAETLPSRATEGGQTDICRICMMNVDDVGNLAVAKCRHTFHRECVEKYLEDFEEAEHAKEEEENSKGGAKKKKAAAPKKSKKKKDGDDDDASPTKSLPKCPSCHLPLTVTLRVHGGSDDHGHHHHHHHANEEDDSKQDDDTSGSTCVICFDRPRNALIMPCGHAYMCFECAHGLENKNCPVCRTKIEKIVKSAVPIHNSAQDEEQAFSKKKKAAAPVFGRKSILQRLKLEEFASSSKLDAIVAEVKKVVESPNRATEKIIVFSQFTTFLDIIQWRLESLKISGVVKLVGTLSMEERRAVLKAFKTDPKVNVILMSLKAGGEGLNLQEATVVLSCDPWWNPSVELQAFHRAHRIGQTRAVRAVRFVTKNTIEERMVELQEKKSLIFAGTVDGNESSLSKLTQEDLRFLFQR